MYVVVVVLDFVVLIVLIVLVALVVLHLNFNQKTIEKQLRSNKNPIKHQQQHYENLEEVPRIWEGEGEQLRTTLWEAVVSQESRKNR